MQFVIRSGRDVGLHAQRLWVEHQRLVNAGRPGVEDLYNRLGDAAVMSKHLRKMAPRDITRTLYHYSRGKVLHIDLFRKLVKLAGETAADFRPGEMEDLLMSMTRLKWEPSSQKVDRLAVAIAAKPQLYSISQTAEVLHCVAQLKHEQRRLFRIMGHHLGKLDPLVGWHMTPADASKLLRAHATARVANRQVMDMVAYRLTRPGKADDMDLRQVSHVLWAMANLGHRGDEFYAAMSRRLEDLVAPPVAVKVPTVISAPLLWAIASLRLDAPLIPAVAAATTLRDLTRWRATIMLWACSHAKVPLADPAVAALVPALCKELHREADALSAEEVSSVVWSLSSLRHEDSPFLNALLDGLRREEWRALQSASLRSAVDMACSYAQARIACSDLMHKVSDLLGRKEHIASSTMTRFGWALVTTEDPAVAPAFRSVSLWARRVDLNNVVLSELANLLWAAAALSVDKKLQTHVSELLTLKTADGAAAAPGQPGSAGDSPRSLPGDVLG